MLEDSSLSLWNSCALSVMLSYTTGHGPLTTFLTSCAPEAKAWVAVTSAPPLEFSGQHGAQDGQASGHSHVLSAEPVVQVGSPGSELAIPAQQV